MLKPIRTAVGVAIIATMLVSMSARGANAPSTKPAVVHAPTTKPVVAQLPATRPTVPHVAAGGMRPGPAYVIKRMKDAVSSLELSDEQRPKVDAVFDQVNQEGLTLSQELANTPVTQRYQKLLEFSKQIRGELSGVLNDDQLSSLDDKMKSFTAPRLGNRPPGGPGILDNIQQALAKLDLTDDQKQQIKDVMDQVRQKVADVRQKAQAGENVEQDLQGIRTLVRDKLKGILSQEQLQSLADAMQQYYQDNGGGPGSGSRNGGKAPLVEMKPADLDIDGPEIGATAPNVKIMELSGRQFSPDNYRGHVVVIEFGSLSCPVFRQHVQEMDKLKMAEGGRAFFLLVYTREAFPPGEKEIERNRNDGISVADAKTLDERKAQALKTQQQLHITYQMAVDSMDNAVSVAFGGFPNGAVVIGKDGTIAERQRWTNPDTLRMAIDDAVAERGEPVASVH
jgi:Spy/CpxP family protein refolding chaperone